MCAIDAVPPQGRPRLLMSPRGKPLTQARVEALARGPGVIVVCGRFEGIDERVIAGRDLEEVSLGDYVLSGGEVAALVLLDACVRLLPGVVGAQTSVADESFSDGLLEYPQFTRPQVFEGRPIRRCWSRATMPRSPTGGAPRPSGSPVSDGPIWASYRARRPKGPGETP